MSLPAVSRSVNDGEHQPPRSARVLADLGYTLFYLSLLVLIPLAALFFKATLAALERVLARRLDRAGACGLRLTFGASLVAALVNVVLGLLMAWVLVRYEFPGQAAVRRAGGSAVRAADGGGRAGVSALYVQNGWLGQFLVPLGIKVAYSPLGDRAGADLHRLAVRGAHGAAGAGGPRPRDRGGGRAALGATRWQTFRRVILPRCVPALMTGFALAFARALGEYGSVVFVSGNMPYKTEIAPVLIVARLEEFAYARGDGDRRRCCWSSRSSCWSSINLLERWSRAAVAHSRRRWTALHAEATPARRAPRRTQDPLGVRWR